MSERTWESDRILREYLDFLLEKMRSNPGEVFIYDHGKEQIEVLQFSEIRRIAKAENAMEQMLLARASYKAFVAAAFLDGKDYYFGWSLRWLEDTARNLVTSKAMPARPRFLEKFFQN